MTEKWNHRLKKTLKLSVTFWAMGKPDSNIWFVGIEEGGSTVEEDDLVRQLEVCKKITDFIPEAKENGSVPSIWNIISELMYDKTNNISNLTFEEYGSKLLSEDYSYFFLTNLFPLPRPQNNKWSEKYIQMFGFESPDLNYISDVRFNRYPLIYKLWKKSNPKLTICCGIGSWDEFINLLQLGHSFFNTSLNSRILYFPEEKVLLTPFFSNRGFKRIRKKYWQL